MLNFQSTLYPSIALSRGLPRRQDYSQEDILAVWYNLVNQVVGGGGECVCARVSERETETERQTVSENEIPRESGRG